MDSLNIISYFSVALNTEIRTIHKQKKKQKNTTSAIQIFLLNIYFLCSHNK